MYKPNLSGLANNDWDVDLDIDQVLAEEAQRSIATETEGNRDFPQNRSVENSLVPVGQENNKATAPNTSNPVDHRLEDLKTLEGAIGGSIDSAPTGLDPTFRDSGTITGPQQHLNSNSNNDTQHQLEDNVTNNNKDPYILALEVSRDLGILNVPDDFKWENLDEPTLMLFKEQTMMNHRQDALEFVRSKASADKNTLRLFDYAIKGTKFADIPSMQDKLSKQQMFTTFSIDSIENQKAIVELYLKDGLDPSDPRNEYVLNSIPEQLVKLEKDIKLKTKALEAKQFFVAREEYEISEQEQQLLYAIEQEHAIKVKKQQEQHAWNNQFIATLEESNWSEGKKDAVKKEATMVELNDGSRIPMWQHKQNLIFENPVLFQRFLDFTSSFDLTTGNFEGQTFQDSAKNNETIEVLLNRIQQKQKSSATSTRSNTTPIDNTIPVEAPVVTDINNSWFM